MYKNDYKNVLFEVLTTVCTQIISVLCDSVQVDL